MSKQFKSEFISETFVIKQPFEISGTLHLQTLTDKIQWEYLLKMLQKSIYI